MDRQDWFLKDESRRTDYYLSFNMPSPLVSQDVPKAISNRVSKNRIGFITLNSSYAFADKDTSIIMAMHPSIVQPQNLYTRFLFSFSGVGSPEVLVKRKREK